MKIRTCSILLYSAALLMPLAFSAGCAQEMSHSESDTAGWFGGQTHATNTVYKNSDGSTSIETESKTVNGNVTTIVRERKTTNLDGTVRMDRETRTITKGTDNVERVTKTTD